MKKPSLAGAAALALLATGLVAIPSTAQASGNVPVVKLAVAGNQATISQATMRPGVVEFQVGNTFKIPGPQGGPDPLTVLRTDQLDLILSTLPTVFSQSDDPAAGAASAAAMRTIRAAGTFYGGGAKGMTWQVRLPAGNYTVMGVQSTAMGMAKAASFTVAGEPRPGAIHATQAAVRAVGAVGENRWTFSQPGDRVVEWLRFANAARELHFMDMSGVKPGTTDAMVKKALTSNKQPTFFTDVNLSFDVISPGVAVAIKGPIDAGDYLVDCFIPSEIDGMPHALMGMWKLVDVS